MQVFQSRELPPRVTETCLGTFDTMIWGRGGTVTDLGEGTYCDRFTEAGYYLKIILLFVIMWVRLYLTYKHGGFFFSFSFFHLLQYTLIFPGMQLTMLLKERQCLVFFETLQELLTVLKYQHNNTILSIWVTSINITHVQSAFVVAIFTMVLYILQAPEYLIVFSSILHVLRHL